MARLRPAEIWRWIPYRGLWLGVAAIALAAFVIDARLAGLLGNTILLVAGTLAISLPLGIAAAVLLTRTDMPGRRVALALLASMLLVPVYLQAAAWQAGFGLQGWITLNWTGDVWLSGFPAAVWVHGLAAVPWAALIVGVGLRLVEPELEEQALLDSRPAGVFWHVTLPGCSGAIKVAAVWVAITTSAEIAVTDLFAVRTFAEEIYTQSALGPRLVEGEPIGPPRFLGCLLLSAAFVLVGLIGLLAITSAGRPPSRGRPLVYSLGQHKWKAAVAVAVVLLGVVGVPLVNLAAKAGIVVTRTETGRVRSWSIGKLAEMVSGAPREFAEEFGWTLLIGTLAATAALALGVAAAWLAHRSRRAAPLVWLATAVALATPGPAIGLAVIWLVNRPEIPLATYLYDYSIFAPWLAQTIRALPPVVLILWFAFRSIPAAVLDASRVDGAGMWRQLVRIALPMRCRAMVLAWLAAAVVAMGDLAASVLTVPPGVMTLPIQIFTLLHYGVEDRVAGLCLASALWFVALTLLLGWMFRRKWGGI
jgi:iron(III) transport system permease protein